MVTIDFNQIGDTVTLAKAGKYEIIIDRPVEKGGSGAGTMGGQTLLMGIGGCFCSTLYGAAQARNLSVKDLKLKLSATLSDSPPSRFTNILIEVLDGSCSEEGEFDKLVKIAEKGCISVNTIKTGLELTVKQ